MSEDHDHDDEGAIWWEPIAETPELPEEGFGISFNFIPDHKDHDGGPTVALAAAFRLPGRFVGIYGGRITAALQVVVVDARSGSVHYREAEPRTGIELIPMTPGKMLPTSVGGNVNVDLVNHLRLPHERRPHHVFLWLDDHVSRVATFETPAIDPDSDAGTFQFAPLPRSPERGDAPDVVLRAVPGATGRSAVVEGSVYLPGPVVPGEAVPVTILGLCDQTHKIGGTVEPLPVGLERATEWTFRVPVARLIPDRGRPKVLHVVALVGGAVSRVLQVPLS